MNSKKSDRIDILELIKKRCSIRQYKNKPLPKELVDKIVDAGIWGPSITNFLKIQPWKFIILDKKDQINNIYEMVLKKSKKSGIGVNILLHSAANTIGNASVIIFIYNSRDLVRLKGRYKEIYEKFSKLIPIAELSAISATIQNMILTAEYFGIGSCWLDIPLFCEREINKFLSINDKLVALLTLGYPAEKGKRSKRKPRSETVRYLK